MVFGEYAIQPFFTDCDAPKGAVKLAAAFCISKSFLYFTNTQGRRSSKRAEGALLKKVTMTFKKGTYPQEKT